VSGDFGGAALRLAAIAAQHLAWRPSEFWAATPAELVTSLGLDGGAPVAMLDRTQLQRLMETDHDRPG
jgi:hypothetical protein